MASSGLELQSKRAESWEYLSLAHDVAVQAPYPSDRAPIIARVAAALAQEGLREEAIEARQRVLELLERDGGTHTVAYHMAQAELSVAKADGGHEDVVEALCGSLRWLWRGVRTKIEPRRWRYAELSAVFWTARSRRDACVERLARPALSSDAGEMG